MQKQMSLLLHNLFLRPAIADMTTANLIFTSADDLPSFVTVEPRYLKASTSSSFCPFIVAVCSDVVGTAYDRVAIL